MKTITLLLRPHFKLWLAIAVVLSVTVQGHAQLANIGQLYIHDSGSAYLSSGNYLFTSATTKTARTPITYGKVIFSPTATWTGASDNAHIDGYAKTLGDMPFIFPIGNSGVYAPAKVTPSDLMGVTAAYTKLAPSGILDGDVGSLSTEGYWNIYGGSAQISLSWRASTNVSGLVGGDISNLIMVGFNGSMWTIIPSLLDNTSIMGTSSTLTAGSLTSLASVDLSAYTMYALASKGDCLPLIASSGIIKTWNGTSWSPSVPTLADPVVINGAFSGNLLCNTLQLNADITIGEGQNIEIVNGATGPGKIIMSANANVSQHSSTALAPLIEMTKMTSPMRRFDYVFISNPINSPTSFFTQVNSPNNAAVNGAYGAQPLSAFSSFKTINESGVIVGINTGTLGKGMRALVRNQSPYTRIDTPRAWDLEKFPVAIKVSGTANNGDIPAPIPANNWAFIGNPYPSAIDGSMLLKIAGAGVRKTLYYWSYNTPMTPSFTYSNNDFATWTQAGGVAACATCPVPDGSIGTMQSVYVKGTSGATDFSFTNCMRLIGGGLSTLRYSDVKDRYWLSMNGTQGSFSQILTSYNNGGVLDVDDFDGPRINNPEASMMSSLIATTKYAIQSRGTFDAADKVPLSVVRKNEEELTISLSAKEGIFSNEGIKIFVHDINLNLYYDLTEGTFVFSDTEEFDNKRFEIVYDAPTLSIVSPGNSDNVVFPNIRNEKFTAQASLEMEHINIYDIAGRLIMSFDVNAKSVSKNFNYAQGVYIAKIRLVDGSITSKKLINR